MFEELIDAHIATSYTDQNLAFGHFHFDPLRTELINASLLPHEHDLKLLSVRITVYKLGQLLINWIVFDWNIYRNFRLEVDAVNSKSFHFSLHVFYLLKKFKVDLISFIDSLL